MTLDQRMRGAALVLFGFWITRRTGRLTLALRAAIFFLDSGIDLFTVHFHLGWRLDTKLDLAGTHLEHGDLDRITDSNVLA